MNDSYEIQVKKSAVFSERLKWKSHDKFFFWLRFVEVTTK